MKLILLFEIDEEKYNLDDLWLEYHIYDYTRFTEVQDYKKCGLRLLPPKKDINFAEKKGNYYEMYTKNYVQGWNDFRDEIIGRIK